MIAPAVVPGTCSFILVSLPFDEEASGHCFFPVCSVWFCWASSAGGFVSFTKCGSFWPWLIQRPLGTGLLPVGAQASDFWCRPAAPEACPFLQAVPSPRRHARVSASLTHCPVLFVLLPGRGLFRQYVVLFGSQIWVLFFLFV